MDRHVPTARGAMGVEARPSGRAVGTAAVPLARRVVTTVEAGNVSDVAARRDAQVGVYGCLALASCSATVLVAANSLRRLPMTASSRCRCDAARPSIDVVNTVDVTEGNQSIADGEHRVRMPRGGSSSAAWLVIPNRLATFARCSGTTRPVV